MKRRWDSVPTGDSAPAGDSAPTVSLVLEDESALKKKVAQYIVENSELRRQMQQQQRMHDEVDDGGECEVDAPGGRRRSTRQGSGRWKRRLRSDCRRSGCSVCNTVRRIN